MRRKQGLSLEGAGGLGPPRQTIEEIWTLKEVSDWLKLRPEQTYELTRRRCRHPLPFVKAGKALRFVPRSVQEWLTATPKKP
jgi:hypothetical protein